MYCFEKTGNSNALLKNMKIFCKFRLNLLFSFTVWLRKNEIL